MSVTKIFFITVVILYFSWPGLAHAAQPPEVSNSRPSQRVMGSNQRVIPKADTKYLQTPNDSYSGIQEVQGVKLLNKADNGYCVQWVTGNTDIKIRLGRYGVARDFARVAASQGYPISKTVPVVGGAVVLDEGTVGHVGILMAKSDTHVVIEDRNYMGWGIVTTRVLERGDPRILVYVGLKPVLPISKIVIP